MNKFQKINDFELSDYKIAYNECDIAVFLVNHSKFENLRINTKNKKVLDFCGILNKYKI